ncbi:MAG: tRNA threonylcarbamoyladenosine biosynthesis protein TsaB [Verrucomicrobiales bacterium]|jgi:tRNA threonylcarbamoyladenosine biosynthesis protein TsaB
MILAIESSTPNGSLALLDPESGKVVFEREFVSDRAHNSVIFEPLAAALDSVAANPDRIVIGTGPGSYSGVRVGIAVANALSIALGAEVIGLPSIVALDIAAESYLVAGDARRNSFYLAEIRDRQLLAAPKVLDPEEFADAVRNAALPVFSTDSKSPADLTEITLAKPRADLLASIGAASVVTGEPIEPLYIRAPYITTPKPRRI